MHKSIIYNNTLAQILKHWEFLCLFGNKKIINAPWLTDFGHLLLETRLRSAILSCVNGRVPRSQLGRRRAPAAKVRGHREWGAECLSQRPRIGAAAEGRGFHQLPLSLLLEIKNDTYKEP